MAKTTGLKPDSRVGVGSRARGGENRSKEKNTEKEKVNRTPTAVERQLCQSAKKKIKKQIKSIKRKDRSEAATRSQGKGLATEGKG